MKATKREEILKQLAQIHDKGIKLTKKNIDKQDIDLYDKAVRTFGTWMNTKRTFYKYIESTRNPEKRMQRIIIKKADAVQEATGINIIYNNSISYDFIKYIQNEDPFLEEIILNTFENYDRFYEAYLEIGAFKNNNLSEEKMLEGLTDALKNDEIIKENVFAKKYTDVYNSLVSEYGSLREGLVHFLNIIANS